MIIYAFLLSFDPSHRARKVKGLTHASREDRLVWDEFNANWEERAFESQRAIERLNLHPSSTDLSWEKLNTPKGPTEKEATVRVRTVQRFFRESVLASYNNTCAVCRLTISEMLCASHIIPWSDDIERRADPTNGLSLCAFHDRAFDRGLITVDEHMCIVVAARLLCTTCNKFHVVAFIDINGISLMRPQRFLPDLKALEYHRTHIFIEARKNEMQNNK